MSGDWAIVPEVHVEGQGTAWMETAKRFVVAQLQSAVWTEHVATPAAAGDLIPVGDEYRFFPDATAFGGAYRPKVDIVAQVTPAVAGISVIMQWYDVDDPTDDDGPIDDDDRLPNDVNDLDNLMQGHNFTYGSTDANGQVRGLWEWTTFHPGNNIRVGVRPYRPAEPDLIKPLKDDGSGRLFYDIDDDEFLTPPEAVVDHTNPPVNRPITRMMTLWRRLHVEVDSMDNVTGNFVDDTAGTVVDNQDGTSTVTLVTGGLETNRFEGGKLWDLIPASFDIVSNTANTVIVNNLPGPTIPDDGPVILKDDDFLQDGPDVPMPDTSTLASAMADAFVTVAFDVGDDNDQVPFILNVGNSVPAVTAAQD